MGMREMLERGICPRCGERMTYLEHRKVGGNTYLYAVHVRKEMKKRHVKKCYLGPESEYINVTHMHTEEGLVLRGMMSYDRALEYLKRIKDYLRTQELDEGRKKLLSQIVTELMDVAGMKGEGEEGIETVTISKEELRDIIQYYDKRSTKGMTSERTKKCRDVFRKVFSPGRRILDVQGS
jgi:hypothetical protein